MTPELEAQRGESARRILDDPLFQEAVEVIRQDILAQWQSSPARDTQGRETLWLSTKLLDKLVMQLKGVMESGVLARATLASRAKQAVNDRFGTRF